MITITLNQILRSRPCYNVRSAFPVLNTLDPEAEITFLEIARQLSCRYTSSIVESPKAVSDLIWCFSALQPKYEKVQDQFISEVFEYIGKTPTIYDTEFGPPRCSSLYTWCKVQTAISPYPAFSLKKNLKLAGWVITRILEITE